MATLSTAARSACAVAILGEIDAATAADFRILTSGAAVLVDIALANPSFTESNGVLTADVSPVPSATASGTGEADNWEVRDGTDPVVTGTISDTGTPDIDIDNAAIVSGQTVNLTSLVLTVRTS